MISGFLVSWMAPDGPASHQQIHKATNVGNMHALLLDSVFAHEDIYVWFVHISQNAEIQSKWFTETLSRSNPSLSLPLSSFMADILTWQTLSKAGKVKQQKCFIIFKDPVYV